MSARLSPLAFMARANLSHFLIIASASGCWFPVGLRRMPRSLWGSVASFCVIATDVPSGLSMFSCTSISFVVSVLVDPSFPNFQMVK